jgi:phosphatidylglycerol lysyltransferase
MGDPVGNPDAQRELVWKYRELCELHRGRCVFYEVDRERLQLYLDLGLTPLKIGEEARIPLAEFKLEGGGWEEMRALCGTMEREGVAFAVIPAAEVEPLLPELRRVSDAWLAAGRKTGGQGFTSGTFDEAYLKRFPVAVLRRAGEIIGFANLWAGADRHELSVDLLRCLPGAPDGTMDYLFVRLMQWGREQGYGWFNLGMSPLSGEEALPLSPEWAAFGELIYRHGEHFYNFDGLRRYKAKFKPVWRPKYLAYSGKMPLRKVLRDVAALIAGGTAK